MQTENFDAIIIGTGQAGNPLATALGRAGLKTAIIEKGSVGGTCVNVGCTPTKTMVASAKAAWFARNSEYYGVSTGSVDVDFARIRERKQSIVDAFSSGGKKGLEKAANVELIPGFASFHGPGEVSVALSDGGSRSLTADKIFINTGLTARIPDLPGLQTVPYLNSTGIMELDAVPEHLIVLGGGYVGLEFGQMFRRFGSKVTLLEQTDQLLPREDHEIAEAVQQVLEQDGITIHTNITAEAVKKTGDNVIELEYSDDSGKHSVNGSHLLIASGRVPATSGLNLEAAGVQTDARGFIKTNSRLETTAEGVYALGDVKGGPAFTHISYDDFRIVRDNLLNGADLTTEQRLVPYTVFTDPQLAHVGLHEEEATAAGLNIRVVTMKMSHVAMALEKGETGGMMKAVVDADTNQILGFTVLGVEGGELMSIVQVAMMGELPYTVLRDAVFTHPSMAESLNNLFTKLDMKIKQAA